MHDNTPNSTDEKSQFYPRHQLEGRKEGTRPKRRRKGPLAFRMHRDYDVATEEAEGFVIIRVFAPVARIRPDHRVLLLRREYRQRSADPEAPPKLVAIYRGEVERDAVRLDDLDATKLHAAVTTAKKELVTFQLRHDDRKQHRRSSKKGKSQNLTHHMNLPQEVVQRIRDLPNQVDEADLQREEEWISRHLEQEVDTSIEEPQKPVEEASGVHRMPNFEVTSCDQEVAALPTTPPMKPKPYVDVDRRPNWAELFVA